MFRVLDSLFQLAVYMAPTIVAWYRKKQGKKIEGSLGLIFFTNFFAGWTVVGWILAMVNALGYNPVPAVALRVAKLIAPLAPGPGMNTPQGNGSSSSSSGRSCGACGGSGSTMCSSCGGRGSWYTQPTTATGMAQLQNCGACTSSGRIRCMSCGGSGRAAALI